MYLNSDSFTNLELQIYDFFFPKTCYDFFPKWQTEKENLFWTTKKLFQLFKLRKTRETNWGDSLILLNSFY